MFIFYYKMWYRKFYIISLKSTEFLIETQEEIEAIPHFFTIYIFLQTVWTK